MGRGRGRLFENGQDIFGPDGLLTTFDLSATDALKLIGLAGLVDLEWSIDSAGDTKIQSGTLHTAPYFDMHSSTVTNILIDCVVGRAWIMT
jgi:hypothetical protein